jgi:hypothetical protein
VRAVIRFYRPGRASRTHRRFGCWGWTCRAGKVLAARDPILEIRFGRTRYTSAVFPEHHWMFSAQTISGQPSGSRTYVMVAVHGVVKTPSSSIVNWSCSLGHSP